MTDSELDSMMEDINCLSDMEDVSDENGEWIMVEQEMESLDLNGGMSDWEYSSAESDSIKKEMQSLHLNDVMSDWECSSAESDSIKKEMQSLHLNDVLEIVHQKSSPAAEFARRIMQTRGTSIEEVVKEHVLPLLPAKSLCRFRAVCRGWNQWISGPFLAHKQTMLFQRISGFFCQNRGYNCHFIPLDSKTHGMPDSYLTFMPGPVNIRSICSGLLCVQGVDDTYYICNPVTKRWKTLPNPGFYHGPGTAVCLAFEPSMFNFPGNFELICAVPVSDSGSIVFEIFSSRSMTWRAPNDICFELANATFVGNACYRDGYAYWVVDSLDCRAILVFSLKIEHYSIIQLPNGSGTNGTLTEMHGELCYMVALDGSDFVALHIYGGMNMSLRHRICIPWACPGNVPRQVCLMGCVDGEVLLCIGEAVVSHRVSMGETRVLGAHWMRGEWTGMRYLPYVNSLVCVNELPELCDNLESMEFGL